MPINRGKAFEKIIENTLTKMNDVGCERLHDQMTGYINVSRNPSDFIIYKYPYEYYVDCKSIHGASIPIVNFKQQDMIKERCKVFGVKGAYIVWFVDKKITFWVDYLVIEDAINNNRKSLNYTTLMITPGVKIIPAIYKRIYGSMYDFSHIFEV